MAVRHKQTRIAAVRNRNPFQGRQVPDSPGTGINIDSLVPGGPDPRRDQALRQAAARISAPPVQIDFQPIVQEGERQFLQRQGASLLDVWPSLSTNDIQTLLSISTLMISAGYSSKIEEEAHRVRFLHMVAEHNEKFSSTTLELLTDQDCVDRFGVAFRHNCDMLMAYMREHLSQAVSMTSTQLTAVDAVAHQPSSVIEYSAGMSDLKPPHEITEHQLTSTTAAHNTLGEELTSVAIAPIHDHYLPATSTAVPSMSWPIDPTPNAY